APNAPLRMVPPVPSSWTGLGVSAQSGSRLAPLGQHPSLAPARAGMCEQAALQVPAATSVSVVHASASSHELGQAPVPLELLVSQVSGGVTTESPQPTQ